MILPRIGIFKVKSRNRAMQSHIVLVDGEDAKMICSRRLVQHGVFLDPENENTKVLCGPCSSRGWGRHEHSFYTGPAIGQWGVSNEERLEKEIQRHASGF